MKNISALVMTLLLSLLPINSFGCDEKNLQGIIYLDSTQGASLKVPNENSIHLGWSKNGVPSERSHQQWLAHFYLSRKKLHQKAVSLCGTFEDKNFFIFTEDD